MRSNSFAYALAFVWSAMLAPYSALAEGIDVRDATLISNESGYVVEADFEITLTHTLEEVLNKGVALYFILDFELTRPRWWWFNEKILDRELQYRLSYNALTRQYRVAVGNFYQNFVSLSGALEFMSRVRWRLDVDAAAVRKSGPVVAALRLRLDTSQLPKPFQLSALGSREWSVSSEWHRWTPGQ